MGAYSQLVRSWWLYGMVDHLLIILQMKGVPQRSVH
jgi:hypothetical protein